MRKVLALCFFLLSACNTTPVLTQLNSGSDTIGAIPEGSYPIEATRYVSFHADRTLRLNRSCTQILKLRLVQGKGYQDTVVELKNRAVLMGGNSVSLVRWQERGQRTGLMGNIYMCEDKTYHLHPHPRA